ncbi:MAG: thioredoxin family protein [Planctomycetota bacterium]|jgi:thioredoxin 1
MNKFTKIAIVSALIVVVGVVVVLKENKRADSQSTTTVTVQEENNKADSQSKSAVIVHKENKREDLQTTNADNPGGLPRLVDLGAGKCVACKMMAPILEELRKEYAGIFDVEFIDVWKNRDAGKKYGIKMIPTQIFFDAAGNELFRHVGFFSREDILAKWKELSVDIEKKQE